MILNRRSSRPASSAKLFVWAVFCLFALLAVVGVGLSTARDDAAGQTAADRAGDASTVHSYGTTTPLPMPSSVAATTSTAATIAVESKPGSALLALGRLSVKGRAPKTGYERDLFGAGWSDTNHNSCGTRDDVLRRDLQSFRLLVGTDGCEVVAGTLVDPYTGQTTQFTRGEHSDDVQIDHIVSLSDAWQKGAQQWSASTRVAFANDLLELVATGGSVNNAKSDSDAASWLPPDKAYRCSFIARQISVKARYDLWVTSAELAAMARVLSRCPDQPTVSEAAATEPKSGPFTVQPEQPEPESSTTSVQPESSTTSLETDDSPPDATSYPNCAAVRAAGAAPISAGDPGYSRQLDGDGDGVACE